MSMAVKINRILVPVDGSVSSTKATDEAIFFASRCGAVLDFVYVESDINKDIPSAIIFAELIKKMPEGVKAETHSVSGNVAKSIIRLAGELGSDMIIMGSRGLGIFRGALIGSVSQKVMEESSIPVMVVK